MGLIKEVKMIWMFRFFDFLSIVLPARFVCLVGKFIGVLTYCLRMYPEGRKNIVENLRQARISSCGLPSFVGFAGAISEFIIMSKLNRKNLCQWAEPVGIGILDSELRKGNGVILLAAHLGSWEFGAAMLSVMNYLINVVSIRWGGEAMTDFYERRRKRKGIKVIYIEELRAMIRALRRGEILAVLGDRLYPSKEKEVKWKEVKFFGKTVKFPFGAFGLAQITQASIVPVFTVHEEGRIRLRFEEPIEELSQYVRILEKYIKKYPKEWCAYGPIWT